LGYVLLHLMDEPGGIGKGLFAPEKSMKNNPQRAAIKIAREIQQEHLKP
jgi:hypothetical protein